MTPPPDAAPGPDSADAAVRAAASVAGGARTSRGTAVTAFVLAVTGSLLAGLGYLPVPWAGIVLVVGAIALLTTAFVLAGVVLTRRVGGTGWAAAAVVVAVGGSVLSVVGAVWGVLFTLLGAVSP